ncbi:MAG: M48 family metalloprotease [Alphaproteobacteria bacterium]|nr:M48 family metalloprotease [Alphaproteobacteria bacterium]
MRLAGSFVVLLRLPALLLAVALLCVPTHSSARGLSLIRDTEIENTIRVYSAPLFRAAGIDASSVQIYLVNDHRLNAFVAGGMRIFIHTGLLSTAKSPGQVIGVLAHEIGHISGGHLSRLQEGLKAATAQSIIATILGGAAAAAAGRADGIGAAVIGGSSIGQRSLLSYTRGMEQAADQAAVRFLDGSGQSSRGLLEFMEILRSQEGIYGVGQDPYLRSHPLTADRIRFVQNHVDNSPLANVPDPAPLIAAHKRMRGKLNGYLDPPADTLRRYDANSNEVEARYARSIAYMKSNEPDKALAIADSLIKQSPKDPFFVELRGDILRDAARTREAMETYEKAIALVPWAALIRISLAQTQLELNDPAMLKDTVANVREAIRYEPQVPRAWRQLATAYGRMDKLGLASHALAEEAMLRGDLRGAMRHAKRAMQLLPNGSAEWIRSQDLQIEAERVKKEREQ